MADEPSSSPVAKVPEADGLETSGKGWDGKAVLSQIFLFLALALFVAFHFLPGFEETGGWRVWPELWNQAQNLRSLEAHGAVIYAAFLSFSFVILVSPFLGSIWRKSGWALGGMLVFSGLSGAAFWLVYGIGLTGADPGFPPSAGEGCLLMAPFFNFLGLILAGPRGTRSRWPNQAGRDKR